MNLGLDEKVKVSTPNSLGVLVDSFPPSSGQFSDGEIMSSILDFVTQSGSTFMLNAYPYYAHAKNPVSSSLDYVLFNPAATPVFDSGSGLTYMFDVEVDAVYDAISKLGHSNVNLTVTETGWPSAGDANEVGASVDNAQSYISNLVQHIESGVGTPARPGVILDTYIYELFNEDKKQGSTSERNYGLLSTDSCIQFRFIVIVLLYGFATVLYS